jgi:tetratricopeptide (TPR) repeat protein
MKKLSIFFLTALFLLASHTVCFSQTKELEQGIKDFNSENFEEALDNLIKAREKDPQSFTAAFYLGMTHKQLENFNEAKKHLEYVMKNNPQLKGTLAEQGILVFIEVLFRLNELDGALEYIGMAEKEKIDPAQTAFLKGLVFAKQGNNTDAIKAFTEAKGFNPSLTVSADFQIASIYMKEGKLTKSQETFQSIVAFDPTSDIAAYAREYSQQAQKGIEERRYLNLKAGFRYEFDDNVMNSPGGNIAINLPTGQKDEREVYTAQAGYKIMQEGSPFSLLTQYNIYSSFHNELDEYDLLSHTLFLIPTYAMKTGQLSLQSGYVKMFLDSEKYSETVSLIPTYQFNIKDNVHIGQLFFKYINRDYFNTIFNPEENMDADVYAGEIGYIWLFAKNKGFFNIKYEFSDEDARGDNWSFKGNKVSMSVLFPFFDRFKLNAYGEYLRRDFENKNNVFLVDRKDNNYIATASLSCTVIKGIDLIAQYTYLRNDTNIELYDYKRNIVSLGIEFYY